MGCNWYVLRSKPNKEDFLAKQLESHEIEVFYPRLHVHPVNPRSRKVKPYFPGYLFVHLDLQQNQASNFERLPGAVNLVNFGGEIAHVPDTIIKAIKNKIEKANHEDGESVLSFKAGDRVSINEGLFEGYEGILDVNLPGSERVRVLLKLLQNKNLKVELPISYVSVIKTNPPSR